MGPASWPVRAFFNALLVSAVASAGWAQAQQVASPAGPSGAPVNPAPGMTVKELGKVARTFSVTFKKGDDPIAGLTAFAEKNHITLAHLMGIGAFDDAVLGFQDPVKGSQKIVIGERAEIVSFGGGFTPDNQGKPRLHVHTSMSLPDGSVKGGHLLAGHVSQTLQVLVIEGTEAAKN
jgi:predicted DNA-binding protein with PD1-like motif